MQANCQQRSIPPHPPPLASSIFLTRQWVSWTSSGWKMYAVTKHTNSVPRGRTNVKTQISRKLTIRCTPSWRKLKENKKKKKNGENIRNDRTPTTPDMDDVNRVLDGTHHHHRFVPYCGNIYIIDKATCDVILRISSHPPPRPTDWNDKPYPSGSVRRPPMDAPPVLTRKTPNQEQVAVAVVVTVDRFGRLLSTGASRRLRDTLRRWHRPC